MDGEAAGVAEEVDDVDAGGEGADGAAVLALIEEEAGLLAVEDVDGEADAVLADLDRRRRRAAVEQLAAAAARALDDVGDAERAHLRRRWRRRTQSAPDADGVTVEPDDGDRAVDVDDDAGEKVALAVEPAEGVGGGGVEDAAARAQRRADAGADEGFVERLARVERGDADGDRRAGVEEAARNKFAVACR